MPQTKLARTNTHNIPNTYFFEMTFQQPSSLRQRLFQQWFAVQKQQIKRSHHHFHFDVCQFRSFSGTCGQYLKGQQLSCRTINRNDFGRFFIGRALCYGTATKSTSVPVPARIITRTLSRLGTARLESPLLNFKLSWGLRNSPRLRACRFVMRAAKLRPG